MATIEITIHSDTESLESILDEVKALAARPLAADVQERLKSFIDNPEDIVDTRLGPANSEDVITVCFQPSDEFAAFTQSLNEAK